MPIDFPYEDAEVRRDNLKIDPLEELRSTADGSVLLMDKITYYCENNNIKLIYPFKKNSLKPASYRLSLGKAYRLDDDKRIKELTDSEPLLIIPPHAIVMVETYEWINLPGYLIGRWNLDSHRVYKGLVWVGGPQVDPGFQGHLSCPIYNLSNTPQKLRYKDPIFIIDFIRTSSFIEPNNTLWYKTRPTYSPAFGPLDEDKIMSAPAETNRKAEDAKNQVKKIENIVFISLTVIVAAIAVMATMNSLEPIKVPSDWTDAGPAWLAILAAVLSILAFYFSLSRRK